jgi:DNA-binding NarL/FixJ family response regulator
VIHKIQVFSSNVLIHLGLEKLLDNVLINYRSLEPRNHQLIFEDEISAYIFISNYNRLDQKRAIVLLETLFNFGLGSKIIVLYYPDNYKFAKIAFERGAVRFINLNTCKNKLSELLLERVSTDSPFYPENFLIDIKKCQRQAVEFKLKIVERKLLEYLWEGMSNYQIADNLCVSTRTVERYRSELIKKTKSPNLIVAIRKMIEKGELQI